ncbi:MAG: beta-ketoacyl-ACP synthase III [Candidatus Dormibacteria bacterium]
MPQVAYAAGATRTAVLGLGANVPEQRITNDDLARVVDTSDSWIRQRTGIAERRRAAPGVTTAELALPAAKRALKAAEVLPSEVELIIFGTTTPDQPFPATACHLQRMLGADGAVAFDVLAACTSWLYAASIAERYISSGAVRRALVIGAEVMSRVLDHADRGTSILFGDGAGAAVLGPSSSSAGFESFALAADGTQAQLIHYGPSASSTECALRMDGAETFRSATRMMEESARRACELAGVALRDIDLVVPHQANVRIVDVVAKRLGVPVDRFMVNLDHYGNTSAASIPLALEEAVSGGRLHTGDRVLLVGFGAGMTWGATVLTWGV